MSIEVIISKWQRIRQQKQLILQSMRKIIAVNKPKINTQPQDGSIFQGKPKITNKNKQLCLKTNDNLQNQTQDRLNTVLDGLRQQLWNINYKKRQLIRQRSCLILQNKQLSKCQQYYESQYATKSNIKQSSNQNNRELQSILTNLQQKLKVNTQQYEQIIAINKQTSQQSQQYLHKQQKHKKQLHQLIKQYTELKQANINTREVIKRSENKIKQLDRQIFVGKKRKQKLVSCCLNSNTDSVYHCKEKQLWSKISAMEKLHKNLTNIYRQFIENSQQYQQILHQETQKLRIVQKKQ